MTLSRQGAVLLAIAAFGGGAACSALIGIEDRPLGDLDASVGEPAPDVAANSPDGGNVPEGCDVSPTLRPDVVDERCGVFVAPSGADTNAGTRAQPLRSLASAVRAAIDQKKFTVFACGGMYGEHVDMIAEGASIIGGLSCDDGSWRVGTQLSVIRPGDELVTLRIDRVARALSFERIQIEAMNATSPGGSSVVAQITGAFGAKFIDSMLVAGNGQAGANGPAGALATGGGAGGNGASVTTPGTDKSCTCTLGTTNFGSTVGGGGGSASAAPTAGTPALGAGGAGTNGLDTCGGGGAGTSGQSGDAGAFPTLVGTLSNQMWAPAAGGDGNPGTIAQGGGGGGAYTETGSGTTYAGGSGGCGGCPSAGSKGGQGGGASVGIVAIDSAITLQRTGIVTHQAGAGGNGGESASGQAGGGGAGNSVGVGCAGGPGGTGGTGGPGAGGAGGCSIGIVYRGQAPNIDADSTNKFVIGGAGMGGTGRIPGPKHYAYALDGGSYPKLDVPP